MLRFDVDSIYNRLVSRLQQDPDWNIVINNSVVSSVLRSNAETNAETARYAEYLFKESKWDTAQNISSILAMAGMLGYKPKRRISSSGSIYISLDPRLHEIGHSLPLSLIKSTAHELNGWLSPKTDIIIPSNLTIKDSNGNSYIPVTGSLKAQSHIGTLNILQGIRKTVKIDISTIRKVATSSKLDPYLYIPFTCKNCENASSPISSAFFKVYLRYKSSPSLKTYVNTEYRVVDTLLFSKSSDRDVEVYNDLYSRDLFYLKFNNDPSRGSILDITSTSDLDSIIIEYVESRGAEGNLSNVFTRFKIANVPYSLNSSTTTNITLYGINTAPITGGKEEEKASDIKILAPKYYISSYTAGTQEAYENTIANLEFPITQTETGSTSVIIRPSKVKVYGAEVTTSASIQNVTKVTFTAPGLDDYIDDSLAKTSIENSLNYYLTRLKAPQDKLVFEFPNYVAFALGVKCKVNKESVTDLVTMESTIRHLIDTTWGASSNDLAFERNFYSDSISKMISAAYPEVITTSVEVEAIKKLDWDNAARVVSNPGNTQDNGEISVATHTARLSFNFSDIFRGTSTHKGFKDNREGAKYLMRIDFMYKKPASLSSIRDYHTSIFIRDNENRNKSNFYLCKDLNNIWDDSKFGNSGSIYSMLNEYDCYNLNSSSKDDTGEQLENNSHSYQYYYKSSVYNDNDFIQLQSDTEAGIETSIQSHLQNAGAIDDYLVYFESDYDTNNNKSLFSAKGWIEVSFDPLYNLLTAFSVYDVNLRNDLSTISLATLKCDQNPGDFKVFLDIAKRYVDVYISLRPIDKDLSITANIATNGNTVLYIDSSDQAGASSNTQNLTSSKLPRMISVSCKYEG